MAFTIYKPGQGYWTRMLTAVGVGVMVLAGVGWLDQQLTTIRSENIYYIRGAISLAVVLAAGGGLWWVLNKPRVVDFMIATEAEMRKVNWPTRREIIGSTWIVICGTFMMALLLLVIDVAFTKFFMTIHVLQGAG